MPMGPSFWIGQGARLGSIAQQRLWIDMSSSGTYPNGGMSSASYNALTGVSASNASSNLTGDPVHGVLLTAENGVLPGTCVGGIDPTTSPARFGTRSVSNRWGKKKEPARTNKQRLSRQQASWATAGGGSTETVVNGPDGANKARRYQLTAGGWGRSDTSISVPNPTTVTYSVWGSPQTGGATRTYQGTPVIGSTAGAQNTLGGRLTGRTNLSWYKDQFTITNQNGGGSTVFVVDAEDSVPGGAIDEAADFMQVEFGTLYASSSIETGTGSGNRAADLDSDSSIGRWITAGGSLNFGVIFVPTADFTSWDNVNIPIAYSSGGDYIYLQAGTGVVIAKSGGVIASIGTIDPWLKDDLVYLEIYSGGGKPLAGQMARAPSGSTTFAAPVPLGQSNNNMGNWSGSGTLHLLDDGTSCGFCGEVQGWGCFNY